MDKREEYLLQSWFAYPAAPKGWGGAEFADFKQSGAGVEVALLLQGQVQILGATHARVVTFEESSARIEELKATDIFRAGDKVAWLKEGEILKLGLLAPCRREYLPYRIGAQTARKWPEFLRGVREFFASRGFVEFQTPSLVVCPGLEPTLEPFRVEGGHYLPTSPELHLKKLLSQSWSEIFEIRSCFRKGEISDHHQPEFTMIEWYRAFQNLDAIAEDLQELVRSLAKGGFLVGTLAPFENYTVRELFGRVLEIRLTPETSAEELSQACHERGLATDQRDSWNDLFHRLWIAAIDPWLATREGPVFVRDFPPSQAALARVNREGWAERMELFWRGLEIGNGFHELNDPEEQRRRFQQDLEEKARMGRSPLPIDEDFLAALEAGMPPSAGIAVGLERLFMAAMKIEKIANLKAFPWT